MYVCFVLGGMFTANTMSSAVETLGMSLPGDLDVLKPLKLSNYKGVKRCYDFVLHEIIAATNHWLIQL